MKQAFSNRQITLMLFSAIVGYGIMSLPKDIAERSGTGGWITLFISTGIAIIFTYIITYLGYIHKGKTIYEYSKLLVGNSITFIFISIYIIYFFVFFTMIIRLSSEVIKLDILIKTPIWSLCSIFLLVAYYTVINRLRLIARICEIYGILIIAAYLTIFFLISTQGDLVNIRPFLESENMAAYIKATSATITPFLGIALLTIIPFNRKTNSKKILIYTTFIMGFIGILYILIFEACISVMGVEGIVYYKNSLIATIRRIDIEWLQYFKRLDGIFLLAWIMALYCTIITFAYGTILLLSKYFKKIGFNLLSLIVIILSFIVSQIPRTINDVQNIITYSGYIGIFTIGIIPLVLLTVTKIKRYD